MLTEIAENVTYLKLFVNEWKQLKKGDIEVYFIDFAPDRIFI